MPDWRTAAAASIVDGRGAMRPARFSAGLDRGKCKEAFTMLDAHSNVNDMSTSSEEQRRTEAALVHAIDMDPSVDSPTTRSAVARYVDLLADEGLLPEAVVIAFKGALVESESLQRFDGDEREAVRSALVSACIERYFARGGTDEIRITRTSVLRLVRDEREPPDRAAAPDVSI
jgi:hypothetical protein